MEQFGDFELLQRIAVGGMAEIFRARMRSEAGFVKDVVVKRVLPHYSEDDGFQMMFIDEARLAAKLNHSNIVQVYNFGTVHGTYYMAMELVEGVDLRKVIREGLAKRKPLGQNRAAQIAIAMARGLGFAHEYADQGRPLKIVHRDVSPHNVLVSFKGDVKVMDFGIAKAVARATHTGTGVIKGKLAYMSPEQARGEEIDARSDIFSTGICLWEMLVGRRLFVGDGEIELLEKVKNAPIDPPHQLVDNVHPDLSRVTMKFLERDREVRYQTMREAEFAIARVLNSTLGGYSSAPLDEYVREIMPADVLEAFRDEPESGTRKTQSGSGRRLATRSPVEMETQAPTAMATLPQADADATRIDVHDGQEATHLRPLDADATRSDSRKILSAQTDATRSGSHAASPAKKRWLIAGGTLGVGAAAVAAALALVPARGPSVGKGEVKLAPVVAGDLPPPSEPQPTLAVVREAPKEPPAATGAPSTGTTPPPAATQPPAAMPPAPTPAAVENKPQPSKAEELTTIAPHPQAAPGGRDVERAARAPHEPTPRLSAHVPKNLATGIISFLNCPEGAQPLEKGARYEVLTSKNIRRFRIAAGTHRMTLKTAEGQIIALPEFTVSEGATELVECSP